MKLWTDEEIQRVESEVARVSTWTESYKNYREIKIKPQQLVDQLVLIGQAFDEIKHYKSKVEEMQKTLEWAARIIDSGMYKGILQYDPKEWFVEYWKLKGETK